MIARSSSYRNGIIAESAQAYHHFKILETMISQVLLNSATVRNAFDRAALVAHGVMLEHGFVLKDEGNKKENRVS